MAWLRAPGPQNKEVDEDVRWDIPPRIIRPKERNVRLRSNMGYCSQRPRPSPIWGSRFVGARAVGPWLGEQKPLGKTPLRGNPSPQMTYLPTSGRSSRDPLENC